MSRRRSPATIFWNKDPISARFEISAEALPFAEEWLGVESIYEQDGKFFADVILPDDEMLVGIILSAGAGFKVLSPDSLRERVKEEAKRILEN